MAIPPYRSPYRDADPRRSDPFRRLLRAEWTKLRSVPRWTHALLAAVVLTLGVALLSSAGSQNEAEGPGGDPGVTPEFLDQGHLVHRSLAGDGSITARVAAQRHSHAWAKAGLMIRGSTRPGAPYVAVVVTPEHGVRLQASLGTDVAGGQGAAPQWLRLTRAGSSVTAHVSPDGVDWHTVGTVDLDGLPARVEAGMFVASPDSFEVERQFGGESVVRSSTVGGATFDQVSLSGDQPQPAGEWLDGDPRQPAWGDSSRSGEAFVVTGSGDIGPFEDEYRDDATKAALSTVLVGVVAIIALAVLFMTAEYKRGTIGTTFVAAPRRGRVLAAKAVVIAAASFAAGTVAAVGGLFAARLGQGSHAVEPPSLADGPVLRAVLGTGLLVAVIAVLSLAVGAIVRRSAVAITLLLLLLLVPQILATGLPLSTAKWLERVTPAAGFAMQETVHRYDTAIAPWAGLGVLCGYAAGALALAAWLLRRRDA